ncbi:MAG: hypothetical protein ACTS3F_12770 [Phycisphaerales bacterium]
MLPDDIHHHTPIRVNLGPRLYTSSDLFMGVAALLFLDALLGMSVWQAFNHAFYVQAAILAGFAIGLAILGLCIKRRAKADAKRRHHARLLIEAAGPHTPDDQAADVVQAALIQRKASRDDLPIDTPSIADSIEARLDRPLPRLWIINEADTLRTRPHTTLPADQPGLELQHQRKAQREPSQPHPHNEPAPTEFHCWPTRFGTNNYAIDPGPTRALAITFTVILGTSGLAVISFAFWFGEILLMLATALAVGVIRSFITTPRTWSFATTHDRAWIVYIRRKRITRAFPINNNALAIVAPITPPALLGGPAAANTYRTRILFPKSSDLPITIFEAKGIDLPTLATSLGIQSEPPPADDATPTHETPPPQRGAGL